MDSVLVVSGTAQGCAQLTELLKNSGNWQFVCASSGAEARRNLIDRDYALVVVNTPLPDEFGHELAATAADTGTAGVLLLVKAELADELAARVEEHGVLTVSKSISRPLFHQALKLACTVRQRVLGLRTENNRLQEKIEEIRLVDRAKCALIQYLGMTEPQAHRYIEKQAMDLRCSRREIAQTLLKTYET